MSHISIKIQVPKLKHISIDSAGNEPRLIGPAQIDQAT